MRQSLLQNISMETKETPLISMKNSHFYRTALCAVFSACFYFLRKKQEIWHHRIMHPKSTIKLLIVTLSWEMGRYNLLSL